MKFTAQIVAIIALSIGADAQLRGRRLAEDTSTSGMSMTTTTTTANSMSSDEVNFSLLGEKEKCAPTGNWPGDFKLLDWDAGSSERCAEKVYWDFDCADTFMVKRGEDEKRNDVTECRCLIKENPTCTLEGGKDWNVFYLDSRRGLTGGEKAEATTEGVRDSRNAVRRLSTEKSSATTTRMSSDINVSTEKSSATTTRMSSASLDRPTPITTMSSPSLDIRESSEGVDDYILYGEKQICDGKRGDDYKILDWNVRTTPLCAELVQWDSDCSDYFMVKMTSDGDDFYGTQCLCLLKGKTCTLVDNDDWNTFDLEYINVLL